MECVCGEGEWGRKKRGVGGGDQFLKVSKKVIELNVLSTAWGYTRMVELCHIQMHILKLFLPVKQNTHTQTSNTSFEELVHSILLM